MKEAIRTLVKDAISRALTENDKPGNRIEEYQVEVTRTKDAKFGDYSSNIAMVLAKSLRMAPRDLAQMIAERLREQTDPIEKVEVAGPGFLNFFMAPRVWMDTLDRIHSTKESYGHKEEKSDRKTLLEFVSANPTGPLHVGHGRGAAVGDTLARLLKALGETVHTEYYVNDAGNQMKILGRSVLYRMREIAGKGTDFPENHYMGEYIRDLAQELLASAEGRDLLDLPEEAAVGKASIFACDRILEGIKDDLQSFGVTYDSYFSEKTLHEKGAVTRTVAKLKESGKVEEREGAIWFNMEDQEDEKDRVLVRATGEPTYFAADAAYHSDKFERGYDSLIDIWGSDHHGYVPRVKAAIEALGVPPDKLNVLLVQFVTLVRAGEKVSMSTRSGEFVTLKEVLDEVGPDAARFFFLTKRCDSHLDFDLDLAKKQSRDNPVYYVQYAHARVQSIFRIAAEKDIDVDMTNPDLAKLSLPEELKLMKRLADFPDMLAEAGQALEPHRITFYLVELAEIFHAYYHDNKVLLEDMELRKARIYLVDAVRQVVANGLAILGVCAPDRM